MTSPTLAQIINSPYITGPSISTTATYGAQTAEHTNVVLVAYSFPVTDPGVSVSDSNNGAYTLVPNSSITDPINLFRVCAFARKRINAAGAGTNVVTATCGAATALYLEILIGEVAGADLDDPIDVANADIGNDATPNSGPVTPHSASQLAIAYCVSGPDATGPGAGWLSVDATGSPGGGETNQGGWLEEQNPAPAVPVSGTFTANAGPWGALILTFQPPQPNTVFANTD